MKKIILLITVYFFCSHSFADSVDSTLIFGDRYIGFFADPEQVSNIVGYQQPDLASKITTPINILFGCMTGSSGGCTEGIPYKKISKDKKGNIFYLAKTEDKQEVWILAPAGATINNLDIEVGMGGSELIYPENEALTNTEKQDNIPDLKIERAAAFKKIYTALSYNYGKVDITLSTENSFKVWPSSEKFSSNFILIDKETLVALGDLKENNILQLEVLRASGNYLLIKGNGVSEKIFTSAVSPAYSNTYFWLDISNLNAKQHPISGLVSNYSDPLVINDFVYVEKIKTFNGNQYALISAKYIAIEPTNFNKAQNTFTQLDFSVPLYWVKIRDANGMLRFWFEIFTAC